MNTWNPRDEILSATHRWYWIVLSFFLGALLGWLVSFIWPAPYRATLDLYVGLNAYRAPRDLYIAQVAQEEFTSLDDYKNWQMGQLNSLAFSDEFLAETLHRLQAADASWQSVEVPTLREMLSIAWRNTGDWHFRVKNADPKQASLAVVNWSQVVTEKVNQAVTAAREMVVIDSQLSELSQTEVDLKTRQTLLRETNLLLANWMNYFEGESPDNVLSSAEHWALLSQVTNAASWNLAWMLVLEAAPPFGASPADYQAWLLQVIALIETELTVLPPQIEALAAEHAALAADYNQAADQSRALSANLEVQSVKAEAPQIEHLQPLSTLLLIGGLIGVLGLSLGWLVQITRKTG